jgi:hypothetical protein
LPGELGDEYPALLHCFSEIFYYLKQSVNKKGGNFDESRKTTVFRRQIYDDSEAGQGGRIKFRMNIKAIVESPRMTRRGSFNVFVSYGVIIERSISLLFTNSNRNRFITTPIFPGKSPV